MANYIKGRLKERHAPSDGTCNCTGSHAMQAVYCLERQKHGEMERWRKGCRSRSHRTLPKIVKLLSANQLLGQFLISSSNPSRICTRSIQTFLKCRPQTWISSCLRHLYSPPISICWIWGEETEYDSHPGQSIWILSLKCFKKNCKRSKPSGLGKYVYITLYICIRCTHIWIIICILYQKIQRSSELTFFVVFSILGITFLWVLGSPGMHTFFQPPWSKAVHHALRQNLLTPFSRNTSKQEYLEQTAFRPILQCKLQSARLQTMCFFFGCKNFIALHVQNCAHICKSTANIMTVFKQGPGICHKTKHRCFCLQSPHSRVE